MSSSPTDGKACAPAPLVQGGDPGTDTGHFVMSKKAWPMGNKTLNLSYYFLDGTDTQQKAVNDTIGHNASSEKWSDFANVTFVWTPNQDDANIRVSFTGQGSWSYIGTDAKNVTDKNKPTLNLGWLPQSGDITDADRGTILHEFGHSLGLMHEHQSPARGGKITLNLLAVYNYYRPLLNYNDALVKSQVVDVYNSKDLACYSDLDLKSVMMYFMPAKLNEQGIEVGVNTKLSQVDKAYITINYPGKENGGMSIHEALNIAQTPKDVAAEIEDLISKKDYDQARKVFSTWNLQTMAVRDVNANYLATVDPNAGAQHGIFDKLKAIISNPIVQGVVKNLVNGVLQQRAIPTQNTIPGAAPRYTRDVIGTLIASPEFAKAIHDINTQLIGIEDPNKPWPPTIG